MVSAVVVIIPAVVLILHAVPAVRSRSAGVRSTEAGPSTLTTPGRHLVGRQPAEERVRGRRRRRRRRGGGHEGRGGQAAAHAVGVVGDAHVEGREQGRLEHLVLALEHRDARLQRVQRVALVVSVVRLAGARVVRVRRVLRALGPRRALVLLALVLLALRRLDPGRPRSDAVRRGRWLPPRHRRGGCGRRGVDAVGEEDGAAAVTAAVVGLPAPMALVVGTDRAAPVAALVAVRRGPRGLGARPRPGAGTAVDVVGFSPAAQTAAADAARRARLVGGDGRGRGRARPAQAGGGAVGAGDGGVGGQRDGGRRGGMGGDGAPRGAERVVDGPEVVAGGVDGGVEGADAAAGRVRIAVPGARGGQVSQAQRTHPLGPVPADALEVLEGAVPGHPGRPGHEHPSRRVRLVL